MSSAAAYALLNGLFQQCLLRHLSGDERAIAALQADVHQALSHLFGVRACVD